MSLPDLAARSAGGAVLWANDDVFAEKENLIKAGPAEYQPAT
ncbi:allantoicase, partial [Mycobacterium sp. ITM-2017-0098]